MEPEYIEQMQAHIDEGGKLTHKNALELFAEVKRLMVMNDDLVDDVLNLPDGEYEITVNVIKTKDKVSVDVPKDVQSLLVLEFCLYSAVQQIFEKPQPHLKLVKG